ncbi:MAG: hypothetical protein ACTHXA_04210 [Gulosibacter sp.]|uniref:hypothetical protein n=1 Tax=Gulosibacter sp. TaxID=2817531 RepID=UPI003F90728A
MTTTGSKSATKARGWLVLLALILGAAAGVGGFQWGTDDATTQGANADVSNAAGLLVAAAAFITVFAFILLLIGLFVGGPGRIAARIVTIVLAVILIAAGVLLFVSLYPMLLNQ